MGIAERRQRAQVAIRGQILDSARKLFLSQGPEAVTLRRVAKNTDYSPTTIYLYFKNRDALLEELVAHDFGLFADTLARLLRVRDPIERLRKSGIAYVRFALAHPGHYRLMFMTPLRAGKSGTPNHPSRRAYAFLRDTLSEAISQGLLRPEHQDLELVTQAAWAAVHGVASLHIALHADTDILWRSATRTAQLLVDAAVGGVVQKPLD